MIEKEGYYYDPPNWKVCDKCGGNERYQIKTQGVEAYAEEIKCSKCNGKGRLPIHYTPEQWEEAGGVLTDSTPIIVGFTTPDISGCYYSLLQHGQLKDYRTIDFIIIATSAETLKEE